MTKVRMRLVAVLLGVTALFAAGAGQSFAGPVADAAPAASPAAEACGALTATAVHDEVRDVVRATGGVRNSCRGWDRLCVTVHSGTTVVTRCTPLSTGDTKSLTSEVPCAGAAVHVVTRVYDGSVVAREKTSPRVVC